MSVSNGSVDSSSNNPSALFNSYCAVGNGGAPREPKFSNFKPEFNNVCQALADTIVEVNLSKNNLFNNHEVFDALACLVNVTHLDLSYNYLNGALSNKAGALERLEVFIIDNNHITSFNSPLTREFTPKPPTVGIPSSLTAGKTLSAPAPVPPAPVAASGSSSALFSSGDSAFSNTGTAGINGDTASVILGENVTPGSLLHNWTNIRIISCANNSISSIPPEAKYWTKLTTLVLRNNKLKLIHGIQTFRHWTALTTLKLGNNLLTSLPEDIACCTNLVDLDVSYNGLTMLPRNLSCCVNLEKVQLGSNQLADVHPDFYTSCTKLKQLMLYRNKISAIPPEISCMEQLEKLSLASNNLHSLPDEIGSCSQLQELYLNNNAKFSHFPSTAGHLRNLQELAMRKCPALKALPASAGEMKNLRELDVRAAKKQVCKIPPDVAESLHNQHCAVRGGVVKKAKKGKKG
jgi:Leucine-rich repeat (LRR) protein